MKKNQRKHKMRKSYTFSSKFLSEKSVGMNVLGIGRCNFSFGIDCIHSCNQSRNHEHRVSLSSHLITSTVARKRLPHYMNWILIFMPIVIKDRFKTVHELCSRLFSPHNMRFYTMVQPCPSFLQNSLIPKRSCQGKKGILNLKWT